MEFIFCVDMPWIALLGPNPILLLHCWNVILMSLCTFGCCSLWYTTEHSLATAANGEQQQLGDSGHCGSSSTCKTVLKMSSEQRVGRRNGVGIRAEGVLRKGRDQTAAAFPLFWPQCSDIDPLRLAPAKLLA